MARNLTSARLLVLACFVRVGMQAQAPWSGSVGIDWYRSSPDAWYGAGCAMGAIASQLVSRLRVVLRQGG
jgi:hypothetical protein